MNFNCFDNPKEYAMKYIYNNPTNNNFQNLWKHLKIEAGYYIEDENDEYYEGVVRYKFRHILNQDNPQKIVKKLTYNEFKTILNEPNDTCQLRVRVKVLI